MTRLILSTSNVLTGSHPSISRKAGSSSRSNLELITSLQANFLAAQQDYSPPPSSPASQSQDPKKSIANGTSNGAIRPPSSIWTSREGNDYYVPTIDWSLSGLAEPATSYDITLKLFYLPSGSPSSRAQYTRDAISFVLKELDVPSIDLLIVSFPGLSFDGDCEWEADKKNATQGDDEDELATWSTLEELYSEGIVKRLGLAEFGTEKLARFVEKVKVRPVVDQINVRDCCNVPPPLIAFAKIEGIELLTHNDCTDVLPSGTLRELLGPGDNGAGVLSGKRGIEEDKSGENSNGSEDNGLVKGDLKPLWVVKYTAVVRDRGVIENKGYFAAAELQE